VSALAPSVFGWLLTTGWQASVLILLVLLVQRIAGDRLAPRFRHALWLLVVLRLALPDLPPFPTSLFGLLPTRLRLPTQARAAVVALVGAWLAVAVFLGARIAWRAYRLTARVGPKRPVTRPDVIDLLEDCKQELGMHVPMTVVQSPEIASPALLGFLRPRLLLPERLLESFDRDALRLLFLHEIAHAKRRDILVNWIATAVHVVHWWNPLVAYALARMRAEREIATDAAVLAHEPEASGRRYGDTLIRLLEFSSAPGLLPGTAGVLEDRSELERRVTMIVQHRRNPRRGTALFAGLVLALGLTTLTRAAGPPKTPTDVSTAVAEEALEPWMQARDARDHARTWEDASPVFKEAITAEAWAKAAEEGYATLGDVRSREALTKSVSGALPGMPDGWYAVFQYRTVFEKAPDTVETYSMRLDPSDGQRWTTNGVWRVIGHSVRPNVSDPTLHRALNEWLALVDGKEYAKSWDEASPDFRALVARGDWSQQVRAARGAYGALVTRIVTGSIEQVSLPGARPGRYVVAQTNASFEKKSSAVETVTLQLAPDGRWRVLGYLIQ
jgi:beta-lactamase regulating signal transducer with metallopeptidase domain